MADFLKLNNIAIPVEDGSAAYGFEEHGSRQRTMDGSLRTTRTSVKRVWTFKTPVLNPEQTLMIAGLVAGNGHHFPFDVDAFDLKGFGPLNPAAANVYSIRKGVTDLIPQPGEAGLKYGGALAVENGTTNMLAQNVRTGTDTLGTTAGFTNIDACPTFESRDPSTLDSRWVAFQGTKVLRFTTSAVVNGVRGGTSCTTGGGPGAVGYSAQVYVQASGAVRCQLKDVTNGVNGTIQTVLVPEPFGSTKWTRMTSTVFAGAVAPTLVFEILEDTADSGVQVLIDALQVEQQQGPTSWVDGARATGFLRMDVQSFLSSGRTISEDVRTAVDLTVMFWANRGQSLFPDLVAPLYTITQDFGGSGTMLARGHFVQVTFDIGASQIIVEVGGNDVGGIGSVPMLPVALVWPFDGWKHFAVVIRRNSVFGTDLNQLKLYVDGVLHNQALASGAGVLPNFSKTNAIYVGNDHNVSFRRFNGGLIDDFVVVPYAMTAAGVSAVFGSGRAFSDLPRLDAEGAGIVSGPPRAIVLGELPSGEFVQAVMDATFTQNNRSVEILLTEV